ncbi:ABC transporter substrate-binding protein [Telmatospirillum siberiense]|uniref:Nitrate ABC transporter substrate-binding protein n=1 Tax=Telmatospirillum siberiense TaxID=382514 RepID=A0A2N3PXP3_9PROT|nr:ABC transporter substrate-binding protein [Telmatospirillum siberiense]PKU25183.1 nitrate ABC transporter substrate-binding protein [Telmatospirillum siberiense]
MNRAIQPRRAVTAFTFLSAAVTGLLFLMAPTTSARAEVSEVRIAQQFGIGYLPFHVMKHERLFEKEAARQGIDNLKVSWTNLAGGAAANEALLSGSLDFVSGGVAPFVTLWAKTRGNLNVRGVAALDAMPIYLVTNNPRVTSLKDLSDKDKIGLPAVKVSIQAVTLQMAAEQAFGEGKHDALDQWTVTLRHPDAYAALVSGKSEITGHFGGSPYQEQELAQPGTRLLVNSYDVLGGPATFNLVWTTQAFREANPKVYSAFLTALHQAETLINEHPDDAVGIYLAEDDLKLDPAFVRKLITSPETKFTTTPLNVTKYVSFMSKTGAIKTSAQSWKDLFFPEIHGEPGS